MEETDEKIEALSEEIEAQTVETEVTSGSFETTKYGVRGLKFNWWVNSQSINGNYTDIGYNYVGNGTETYYYEMLNAYLNINGSRVYTQDSNKIQLRVGTVVTSGTARIYHNNDGTKSFSADGGGGIYYFSTIQTGSGSWKLPAIPRQANILTATDFTDEDNPVITFNNQGGFKLNTRLEFEDSTIERNNISNTGSYIFELTEIERNLLRSKCTSSSMIVRIVLATCLTDETEDFWSYQDKNMSIINANPIFDSNITYKDTNIKVVAITNDDQKIVRNNSNLVASFEDAIAQKYAVIERYEVSLNNSTQIVTSPSEIDFGIVNASQDLILEIKAIDSRGNSSIISKVITILDWIIPTATITAGRINNYEDETKVKAQVTISSVNSKNSVRELKLRYKKTSDLEYSEYKNMVDNEELEISIDKLFAWNIQLFVSDKFGSKIYNFIIAKGTPIMFIDINLKSIGINCFPQKENSLEVGGKEFLDYEVIEEW